MRLFAVALLPALISVAAVTAQAEPLARPLDTEEMMSGLPNVSSGIVFRIPGNTPLLLDRMRPRRKRLRKRWSTRSSAIFFMPSKPAAVCRSRAMVR